MVLQLIILSHHILDTSLSLVCLLPLRLCCSTFVLGTLSSTKAAAWKKPHFCFCERGRLLTEWLPLSRLSEQALRTHHTLACSLCCCYWSPGWLQNRFNGTRLLLSLHHFVETCDFLEIFCVSVTLLCKFGLVHFLEWSAPSIPCPYMALVLLGLWMTSHPKQQILLCRS